MCFPHGSDLSQIFGVGLPSHPEIDATVMTGRHSDFISPFKLPKGLLCGSLLHLFFYVKDDWIYLVKNHKILKHTVKQQSRKIRWSYKNISANCESTKGFTELTTKILP